MSSQSSLAAILAEQRRAAAAVIAEPGRGVRLWLADVVAEELAIMEEAMSETTEWGKECDEASAAAVIAAHEAQRPAWPAMRLPEVPHAE